MKPLGEVRKVRIQKPIDPLSLHRSSTLTLTHTHTHTHTHEHRLHVARVGLRQRFRQPMHQLGRHTRGGVGRYYRTPTAVTQRASTPRPDTAGQLQQRAILPQVLLVVRLGEAVAVGDSVVELGLGGLLLALLEEGDQLGAAGALGLARRVVRLVVVLVVVVLGRSLLALHLDDVGVHQTHVCRAECSQLVETLVEPPRECVVAAATATATSPHDAPQRLAQRLQCLEKHPVVCGHVLAHLSEEGVAVPDPQEHVKHLHQATLPRARTVEFEGLGGDALVHQTVRQRLAGPKTGEEGPLLEVELPWVAPLAHAPDQGRHLGEGG
mmetsp:Transcript_20080/g.57442  ORF Transcript_20080/g.57442 Transcript_20080/m.57442 type:complete len:324 (-) Transcript_20080:393-1364(-)